MTTNDGTEERLLVSYLTLRRVVGILGVALPVLLASWGFVLCDCWELQDSISDYYSLRTRDAFVGILFVVAWFLFAYKGYEPQDNIAGDLACLFALCVALFPNNGADWEKTVHYLSAAALFSVLSYFSLCLFTKSVNNFSIFSNSGDFSGTPEKKGRNRIYVACGLIMLVCIILIGLCKWFLEDTAIAGIKPVFWLELFALWAFGFSWFVKGETLWKDPKQ